MSIRKTYGNGTRHEVINRAIRAELTGGNECLETIRALNERIANLRNAGESTAYAEQRLRSWEQERDKMATHIEAKHQVGANMNRRGSVAS
jgi:hypothetical protein